MDARDVSKKEMYLLTGGNGCEFTFFRICNIMDEKSEPVNKISKSLNKAFLHVIKIGIKLKKHNHDHTEDKNIIHLTTSSGSM